VIFQARCPVLSTDTPHDLATRVHTLEYAHYPRVIAETIAKL
jgi:phosphoribosylglycinamide formyltransferase-1